MRPAAVTTQPGRKRRGCLVVGLSTFLFLILLLGVAWIFAIRPYVHDQIVSRVDSKITSAINAIPPLPSTKIGVTIPVTENIINTALSFGVAPSDPVQQPTVHFTTNRIRFEFQVQFLFSFPCAFSWTPQVQKGQLVATNVSVEGIMGLVMSPEETQQLIDKEFKKAFDHIGYEPKSVQVKDGEIDVTVQGKGNGSGTPIPIPTAIPSVIPTAIPTGLPTLPIG